MSNKKSTSKKESKHDIDILESSVVTSQKIDKKNNIIISLLVIIIIILCFVIVFVAFNKKCSNVVKCNSSVPLDKNIQYQFINYGGYRFTMPLDWYFIGEENKYEISNKKETIYMTLSTIEDISYDEFIIETYQKEFLEAYQTENNLTINKSYESENNNIKCYVYEGILNNYNYLVIAIGDEDKVILSATQFIDKLTYTNMRQNIIDFATSGVKNSIL